MSTLAGCISPQSIRRRTTNGNGTNRTGAVAGPTETPGLDGEGIENIEAFGGIEGEYSVKAMVSNVTAIHEASVAAADNTVYLPAGHWYIGAPDVDHGEALRAGESSEDRGATGLGFVGDGPRKTFLDWGYISRGKGNGIRYAAEGSHLDVTWRNLTFDGRRQAFDIDAGTAHWGFRIVGDGDFRFENVRVQNWDGNAIFMSNNSAASLELSSCTFRDAGIGVANSSNGHSVSHHLRANIKENSQLVVKDSEFHLASGSVCDVGGTGGTVTFENCRASGIGNGFCKIKTADMIELDNIYFQSDSRALNAALDDDNEIDQSGGPFLYRLSGDPANTPTVRINDVAAAKLASFGFSVRNGYDLEIVGGSSGPIALSNVATREIFDSAIRARPGSQLQLNLGDLSVHDVDGDVMAVPDSVGAIDTLHWDDVDGLGSIGNVLINNSRRGGVPFAPTVPSPDEVGITTASRKFGSEI